MKYFILLPVFFFIQSIAFSQKIYLQVGINLTGISESNNGQTEENSNRVRFHIGVKTIKKIVSNLGIETGIFLTSQACSTRTDLNSGTNIKSNFSATYFQVPLNLLYHFPIDEDAEMYFSAGPYIAWGLTGKSDGTASVGPATTVLFREKVKFSKKETFISKEDDAFYYKLKNSDYGLNFGFGVDLFSLSFRVNYRLGLANINATQQLKNEDNNKYRVLSLAIAFPLNK
ncbi:MAG: outer membrane beta-barrel protein [Ferruginibacter sp.]